MYFKLIFFSGGVQVRELGPGWVPHPRTNTVSGKQPSLSTPPSDKYCLRYTTFFIYPTLGPILSQVNNLLYQPPLGPILSQVHNLLCLPHPRTNIISGTQPSLSTPPSRRNNIVSRQPLNAREQWVYLFRYDKKELTKYKNTRTNRFFMKNMDENCGVFSGGTPTRQTYLTPSVVSWTQKLSQMLRFSVKVRESLTWKTKFSVTCLSFFLIIWTIFCFKREKQEGNMPFSNPNSWTSMPITSIIVYRSEYCCGCREGGG